MKFLTYLKRHKKSDDTPYVMGGMVWVLAFLILGIFSLSALNHYLLSTSSLASVISSVLVDLTNGDRTARSLGGLTVSPVLTAAAQAKANDMATKGYFAHVSPEGIDSWYWFKQEGYAFMYAGENLAVDFSDSVDVERAWMNSPTHRKNILDGNFTQIGIAVAQGTYQGRPTTFVVQMFGTPARVGTLESVRTVTSPIEPTEPALATTKKPVESTQVATATAATFVLGAESAVAEVTSAEPSASWWQYYLTSPKTTLRYAYYVLALIVLVLFAYVTELEFHKRHTRHVVAAALLLVLMTGLFIVADIVLFAQPILAGS